MSLTSLAADVGTDKGTLSRIETGKSDPKTELVERVAARLGLTMVEFYGEIPPPPRADAPGDPPAKVAASG